MLLLLLVFAPCNHLPWLKTSSACIPFAISGLRQVFLCKQLHCDKQVPRWRAPALLGHRPGKSPENELKGIETMEKKKQNWALLVHDSQNRQFLVKNMLDTLLINFCMQE
jgi:hypothetical protein